MRTTYIGIESLFIENKQYVTIACNIMFEGLVYDEPVYTHIFCSYQGLCDFLDYENSAIALQLKHDIETEIASCNEDIIQIDLPEYVNNQAEWLYSKPINLRVAEDEDIPFECYSFAGQ